MKDRVISVCVTPDNRIVSGSYDKTVRIWDMKGNQLAVCKGHENMVSSVCVTPDNRIVSGSYDKTVRIWDMSILDSKNPSQYAEKLPTVPIKKIEELPQVDQDRGSTIFKATQVGFQNTQRLLVRLKGVPMNCGKQFLMMRQSC